MENKRSFITSISVFTVILAIGLVVNGVLGLSGFEGVYKDALVSRYKIDGEYVKGRVESSLNLGKKLYLLESTVKPLFSQVLSDSPGIDHLYITDTSGKILFTTRSVLNNQYMPFLVSEAEHNTKTYKFLDSWFISMPLYSEETTWNGSVLIEFSQKSIANFLYPYTYLSLKIGALLFVIAICLYCISVFLYGKKESHEHVITIILLLVSQLCFAFQMYRQYNDALSSIFNANMQRIGRSIVSVMDNPMRLVPDLKSMTGVDEYLNNRLVGNEQCSGIFIIDSNQSVLYQATDNKQTVATIDRSDSDITIVDFPVQENGALQLALRINRPLITSILRDMALDSGTIIIVALIFAFILKSFCILQQRHADILVPPEEMNSAQERTALRLIEISTFVFMFAAYVTLSFIPLYIQDVYQQSGGVFFGLKAETVESIPVSTYMIGIMIAMFITLFGMKQLSVRKRYIIMSTIFIAGSFVTICSTNIVLFALSRLIAGFGFGGVLLSTSSLVILYTSNRTRSAGFGTNAAAFASASIASISVGGVIVNKFGYAAGIIVSMIFAFGFLLFALCCLPEPKKEKGVDEIEESTTTKNVTIGEFCRVFFSRHILVYILTVNIPFQIIYWGLFQFLLPLYMSDTLRLSQGNIGRILSIFSVVSLMAATVSRIADKVKNDKLLVGLGAALAGGVMIFFGMSGGGFLLFIAIMLAMGVDNLFIDSIEEVYLESGHVKNVSEENLLQTYKVIEKVLSVFIPSITSIVILFAGFNNSMKLIGLYSAIGGVLFIVFGRNGRWEKKHD